MKAFSALLLFWVSISTASAEVGLPSDFGPISIAASRRAVQSKIQDWSDDRRDIYNRRLLVCASAGVRRLVLASVGPLGPVRALMVLRLLPSLLADKPAVGQGPSAPLYLPLQELAEAQVLTPAELKNLQRLMGREVSELTDRVRLFIDTESFLIKVSTRLYQEQIDLHLQSITAESGYSQMDSELCIAYSLQMERDSQLIKAAYQVVAFYDFLEQDSAD